MTRSCPKPAKIKPRKPKASAASAAKIAAAVDLSGDELDGVTSDEWNIKLKRERFYQLRRENLRDEKKLIETEVAVAQMGDLIRFVWLTASNLSNVLPARCQNASAEKIRAEIIQELNAAKAKVEEYLQSLA